jgi:hypothetical protein
MNKILPVLVMVVSVGILVLDRAPTPAPQPRFEDTLSKAVLRITSQAVDLHGELNGTDFWVEVPRHD